MAEQLIFRGSAAYQKYEELLMRRDALKKEAFQYHLEYARVFGELIIEVFNAKIEAIRLKKTIDFCQTFFNRGENVDQAALQDYIQKELEQYRWRLDELLSEYKNASGAEMASEADMIKIKKIYRRLAKQIHPDMNPSVAENEELKELWQRLVIAYNCNNLKEMEEIEVLVAAVLDRMGMGGGDTAVSNIEEKIAALEEEIETIKNTDPYQYKKLLEDEAAVESKKAELREELQKYKDHVAELEKMLEDMILQNGVKFVWKITL
ncbi:MAG: DnaJ domain-containing protein [Lachnospiraceae bacterium]|nr:DnaJ domain-containing protein [Lachnospiraceae bacterium]